MKIMIAGPIAEKQRRHIFPLLKPFQKGKDFSDEDRQALYHISEKEISFVSNMEEADYAILPMSWNFYSKNGLLAEVLALIEKAKIADKQVLSFMTSDYGIKIPNFNHVIVFRSSGNKSKLPSNHRGLPPFIEDPIQKIYQRSSIEVRPYTTKPVIGFCGMANFSKKYALEELIRIATRNVNYYLGRSKNSPQDLLPTTYRRAQLLKKCLDHAAIDTNFIFRKKYFGGALTESEKKDTTREFFDNINDAQYIICFRGAGNFSVRLYETLAMGRIPVFVNTDCLLPKEDIIQWKDHVVWVEYKERNAITDKILEFHNRLDEHSFRNLQNQNRMLWEEKLTLNGFFNELLKTS